jgi:DNA polymerase I
LFIVDKDMKYVSADAAALENKTVASYTYKYDSGAYARLVLEGDSHSANAKIFFPKETASFDIHASDFNKDDPGFKPYRNKAKSGVYSLTYGASVGKFTKTLGLTDKDGKLAYERYWEANKGLKLFKEAVENYWSTVGKKKYVKGIDGRMLSVRSKHLLVNLCGQSKGAIVISIALCMVDNKLGWLDIDELGRPFYTYKGHKAMRILAAHDQGDYETAPEIADEVGKMIVEGIVKAGEFLKLDLELGGEYKIGNTAAEIH